MKSQSLDYLAIPIAMACLAVSAQLMIKLPDHFSVAPITGQSLAILMIAELMDWKKGSLAVLLYLLLGAMGLPFFADFESGWNVLSGVSAGYFAGFIIVVSLVGYWSSRGSKTAFPTFGRAFVATLLILASGWLGLLRFLSPTDAFSKGILPFLPGAFAKIVLAVILVTLTRKFMGLMTNFKNE